MLPDPSGFGAEDIVCPQEWRCKRFGFRIFSGDFDDRKNRLTDYSKGRRRKKKKKKLMKRKKTSGGAWRADLSMSVLMGSLVSINI